MFTGLIREIGVIKGIKKSSKGAQITISAKKIIEDVALGDSIATNGVCLTVVSFDGSQFTVDVMPETMRLSNLSKLNIGSLVNLEPALALGERFGGHIVSGHIDGIGTISRIEKEDNATWVTIDVPHNILKYMVLKGSVAIDGTSLTVAKVSDTSFSVSIIPLTKEETTLLKKKVGEIVNIECDVVGKYVERLISFTNNEPEQEKKKESKIDTNFLAENGFL